MCKCNEVKSSRVTQEVRLGISSAYMCRKHKLYLCKYNGQCTTGQTEQLTCGCRGEIMG